MYELKKLTVEGVGNAIWKADHYRLLGEPREAESICMDILDVNPNNQDVKKLLVLSLTDQFRTDFSRTLEAAKLASELEEEYDRFYLSGIVAERRGKVHLIRGGPCSDDYANRALREAMGWYEKAEAIRPPGEDDPILRWNTCARMIARRGFNLPPDMPRTALVMTE
jgi:hypothetical protein